MPAVDGDIRRLRDGLDGIERHERTPRTIVREAQKVDDRMHWQMPHPLFEIGKRQPLKIVEGHGPGQWRPLFFEDVDVELVERGHAAHDEHVFRVGLRPERRRHRAREVDRRNDTRRIRSGRESGSRGEHDRHRLEERGVAVQECHDGRPRGDDEIHSVAADVSLAQVAAKCGLVLVVDQPLLIDIFAVVIQAAVQLPVEHRAKRVVEFGRVPPDQMQRQDLLRRGAGRGLSVNSRAEAQAP